MICTRRSSLAVFAFLAGLVLLPAAAPAHPGHGEVVLHSGEVVAIEAPRVQLEVFDKAAVALRKIWVVVDAQTVVRIGKARLKAADLRVGQKVDFAGETDEDPDGKPMVRAVTFRVTAK